MHAAHCQAYRSASWDAAIASRAAAQAGAADSAARGERRRCHDDADDGGTEHAQRAGRGHSLVAAMTEALRSLLPAGAATPQSAAAEDGARDFAHELVDALREQGGRPHGRHAGHHGYDDLAQRLERLAGSLESSAPANGTGTSSTSLSASLTTATLDLTIDANGTSASLTVSAVALNVSQQTAAAAAPVSGDTPLLAAFRRLMSALQPDAAPAEPAGDSGKLSAFLRQLAGALRSGGPSAEAGTRGGLVSLAA